jgi:hypothetical protein
MIAISAWTWVAAAAFAVGALAFLTKVTIGLLRRLKELNATLQGASGQLNESLDEMRGDLDRVSEGLETLRRSREQAPDQA